MLLGSSSVFGNEVFANVTDVGEFTSIAWQIICANDDIWTIQAKAPSLITILAPVTNNWAIKEIEPSLMTVIEPVDSNWTILDPNPTGSLVREC